MNRVIIFRNELLPISETFIKEQALALTDWEPVLVGYRRATNGLDLTGLDVNLLSHMTSNRLSRWRTKLARWRGRPHPPTVRALRSIGANLLHAHFGTDATDIWPSARAIGLPMVVTLHGYDINIHRQWWESGKGGLLRRNYPRRLLRMAQDPRVHFIAVSNAIKARAIEYGIPENKVTVAYIGVNTERFQPGGLPIDQRPPRILFVGRMVEKKAPLLMIRAFAKVRESMPDAELVMVGSGPLLDSARKLSADLAIPVDFRGTCNPGQVLKQMHQARVFCLPSVAASNGDAEGLPISILEALACGIPVVTSANGAVDEAVHDRENGYTYTAGDLDSMAESLASELKDNATLQRHAIRARQLITQKFDITRTSRSLSAAYDQAI